MIRFKIKKKRIKSSRALQKRKHMLCVCGGGGGGGCGRVLRRKAVGTNDSALGRVLVLARK